MDKPPYSEQVLEEPEPAGRDPWDAWRTAKKYSAPFFKWWAGRMRFSSREQFVLQRRIEGAQAMQKRLGIDAGGLRGRALDLGCGPVSMLEGYDGLEVVAIDPAMDDYVEAMPQFSSVGRVNNCDYRNCFIQDVVETGFKYVWCYNVLDHAVDWRDILFHVYRVLRPGGQLLLITDIRREMPANKEFRVCHPLAFPVDELLDALEAASLSVWWKAEVPEQYDEVRCWSLIALRVQ
jgi:2-polyprenyl-3-methyl-5-hydroxy-6-metoxy-1,4-benzoquinol methylase